MVRGKCRGRNASLAAFFLLRPLLGLSHSAITSISHSPPLSASHLLLRALDECGGLITFFRERISMSCPECSGLMHKEQAARAQKTGAGESQTLPPLANQSHFRGGWGLPKTAPSGRTLIGQHVKSVCCWTHQFVHVTGHVYWPKWSRLWLRSGKRE